MREKIQNWLMLQRTKIQKLRQRDANTQMDLLRLYGMFCVVYAHCYMHGISIPGFGVVSSVYVIQLFIFSSGYFYRPEQDGDVTYLRKCAKGYLLPYFLWNLVYGLIHQVFYAIDLIRFGADLNLYTLLVRPWLDAEQFGLNIPSWFLLSLFLCAVAIWCIRTAVFQLVVRGAVAEGMIFLVLSGISLLVLCWVGQGNYYLNRGAVARPLIILPYFQLGILYRTYGNRLSRKHQFLFCVLLCFGLMILYRMDSGLSTKMLYCYFVGNPVLLLLGALASVLMVTLACGLVAPLFSGSRLIRYSGRCTMYIMLHHMLVLYAIQFLLFCGNHLWGLSDYSVAGFKGSIWYRYCFGDSRWMLLYILVAMLIPVIVHRIYEEIILTFCKTKGKALYISRNVR